MMAYKKTEGRRQKAEAKAPKRLATLSHVNARGTAHMVDVGAKQPTARRAVARGEIRMSRPAWLAIRNNTSKKGDVLGVARLAGIQAAKRTAELIPLEALTAVSIALLTVYDMVKSADKRMRIGAVRLIEKSGGRSGHFKAR